jgi:hypothetical protein
MGADRFSGPNPKQGRGAKRDAGASGERRNKLGGPIRPTEGRVFLRHGGVALLCRWSPHRHAKRARPRHKIIPVKWLDLVVKCSSPLHGIAATRRHAQGEASG